jgi:hypothetical protein
VRLVGFIKKKSVTMHGYRNVKKKKTQQLIKITELQFSFGIKLTQQLYNSQLWASSYTAYKSNVIRFGQDWKTCPFHVGFQGITSMTENCAFCHVTSYKFTNVFG